MAISIERLAAALRASWGPDTADRRGEELYSWDASNPSRSQCGVTALVVHDYMAGQLLVARVGGTGSGWHYWNRLPSGQDLDLTREQFREGEIIGDPRPIDVPDGFDGGPLAAEYTLLTSRVLDAMDRASVHE